MTEDNVSAQVAEAYDGIVGKTDEEKKLIILRFYKLYCLPFIIQL